MILHMAMGELKGSRDRSFGMVLNPPKLIHQTVQPPLLAVEGFAQFLQGIANG